MLHNHSSHSFSTELAKSFNSVEAAVMIQHFYFWCKKNRENKKHFHDDHWWTYSSRKGLMEYFDYLSENKIRGAIGLLEKKGLIIKGNYNTNPHDRTGWYALTEKGWALFAQSIGGNNQPIGENHQSIGGNNNSSGESNQYIKDNNTNIKTYISLADEEKRDKLEEIWKEKGFKSDCEKYFLSRAKNNWKGVSNLEKDCEWWENGFKDKNPDLYKEPVKKIDKAKEIRDMEDKIQHLIAGTHNNSDFYIHFLNNIECVDDKFRLKKVVPEKFRWVCERFDLKQQGE